MMIHNTSATVLCLPKPAEYFFDITNAEQNCVGQLKVNELPCVQKAVLFCSMCKLSIKTAYTRLDGFIWQMPSFSLILVILRT